MRVQSLHYAASACYIVLFQIMMISIYWSKLSLGKEMEK